jgi:hypothetical protein
VCVFDSIDAPAADFLTFSKSVSGVVVPLDDHSSHFLQQDVLLSKGLSKLPWIISGCGQPVRAFIHVMRLYSPPLNASPKSCHWLAPRFTCMHQPSTPLSVYIALPSPVPRSPL